MSQQTMRQQARRDARTVTSRRRTALLERAKRLEDQAVQVMIAIDERDAAVAAAEQQAGSALREMTTVEGVTLREAAEWCGNHVGVREATRLRRLGRRPAPTAESVMPATADTEGAAFGTALQRGPRHARGGAFAAEMPARESTAAQLLLLLVGNALAFGRHGNWCRAVLPSVVAGTLVLAVVDDLTLRRGIAVI